MPSPPPPQRAPVLIVGAGVAGLAAAHVLATRGHAAVCVEKSRGLGGRAATRRREDDRGRRWRYDHGAQYVSPSPGSPSARLLTETLPTEGLTSLRRAVWPVDDDGTPRPDLAREGDALRLTYAEGVSGLGRRLAEASPGLGLRRQTRALRLERAGLAWHADTDGGERLGPFRAVLLTPPAPQTADLLRASRGVEAEALLRALAPAAYRRQFSVALAFEGALPRPGGAAGPYGLVNPSGGHAVAWAAFESDKPGRAPEGTTLVVAQMADAWTGAHYDDAPGTVVSAATRALRSVLGPLPEPLWADTQRWRYALPDAGADRAALREAEPLGLFFAGDFVAGRGRVHLALEAGLDAGARIAAHLARVPA